MPSATDSSAAANAEEAKQEGAAEMEVDHEEAKVEQP